MRRLSEEELNRRRWAEGSGVRGLNEWMKVGGCVRGWGGDKYGVNWGWNCNDGYLGKCALEGVCRWEF